MIKPQASRHHLILLILNTKFQVYCFCFVLLIYISQNYYNNNILHLCDTRSMYKLLILNLNDPFIHKLLPALRVTRGQLETSPTATGRSHAGRLCTPPVYKKNLCLLLCWIFIFGNVPVAHFFYIKRVFYTLVTYHHHLNLHFVVFVSMQKFRKGKDIFFCLFFVSWRSWLNVIWRAISEGTEWIK